MNLIMKEKISPAQYRAIYHELTGDKSLSVNHFLKERMEMVAQVANAKVIRDHHIHHYQRERSFDLFWRFTDQKIERMTAVVTARQQEIAHAVAHLALAVSARELYYKRLILT